MQLFGIGSLFAAGYGVDALEASLENGWRPPQQLASANRLAYQVNLDDLPDRTLLKKLRRADKFSKMSVLAAAAAVADSRVDLTGKRVGIILATAFGAHVTTFNFLDGIIDFGEANVSPTAFSNSVHNAAASYISTTLDIKGPTLTVSAFRFSFESALQLAAAWLAQGRADYLLVGAVEQYGDVLGHVSRTKVLQPVDGRLHPFSFMPTFNVAGEGALFFLVGNAAAGGYCRIAAATTAAATAPQRHDLVIINGDGMQGDEQGYLAVLSTGQLVSAYAPLWGSIMTGAAFNLAAGALMLKQQKLFAAPDQFNPHRLNIVTATAAARLKTVGSLNLNCSGEMALIRLQQL
jgi:3-oxoacyl-[acyl-carrier-protein] synthase II